MVLQLHLHLPLGINRAHLSPNTYIKAAHADCLSVCLSVCVCTDRGQVPHHEEGGECGVKQEGNPLGGAGRDAEAADAGCVSCYGDTVTCQMC